MQHASRRHRHKRRHDAAAADHAVPRARPMPRAAAPAAEAGADACDSGGAFGGQKRQRAAKRKRRRVAASRRLRPPPPSAPRHRCSIWCAVVCSSRVRVLFFLILLVHFRSLFLLLLSLSFSLFFLLSSLESSPNRRTPVNVFFRQTLYCTQYCI